MTIFSEFHVDWLALTIWEDDMSSDGAVTGFLKGLSIHDSFYGSGHGARGFKTMLEGLHGAKLYLHPVDGRSYVHLVLPAQAMSCVHLLDLWNGLKLFDKAQIKWSVTRLDIAFDTVDFDVSQFAQAVHSGKAETNARSWREDRSSGGGHTFYVGVRESLQMLRVYQKFDEFHAEDNKTPRYSPGGYTRVELELHDERALWAMRELFGCAPPLWGEKASVILKGFIQLDCDWWRRWIGMLGESWVSLSAPVSSVSKIEKWLVYQVLPSLATYVKSKQVSQLPIETLEYLYRLGLHRMTQKHENMVADAWIGSTQRLAEVT